jgi:RNA polymerase sigma-70 factor (ECF subfamily)
MVDEDEGVVIVNGIRKTSGTFDIRQCGVASKISEHVSDIFCDATRADAERVIELYGTLQSPLRAYLSAFGLSADKVDDVIQEVFVRLMRRLRENENGSKVGHPWDENHRGWLFRVAHNFVMDTYRNSHRVLRLSPHEVESLLSNRVDPALDPEQTLLSKERLSRLDTAISKLNIEQRSCLLLRAKGLRHREIGSELGISAQHAAKLVHQGLGLLAGELRT